jgi:hypothetical protein
VEIVVVVVVVEVVRETQSSVARLNSQWLAFWHRGKLSGSHAGSATVVDVLVVVLVLVLLVELLVELMDIVLVVVVLPKVVVVVASVETVEGELVGWVVDVEDVVGLGDDVVDASRSWQTEVIKSKTHCSEAAKQSLISSSEQAFGRFLQLNVAASNSQSERAPQAPASRPEQPAGRSSQMEAMVLKTQAACSAHSDSVN